MTQRELTEVEIKVMAELMEKNQLLDPLFLQTLFTMDPEHLKEMCDLHRAGKLKDPYPNKDHESNVFQCVEILDETEANPIPVPIEVVELEPDQANPIPVLIEVVELEQEIAEIKINENKVDHSNMLAF